MEDFLLLNISAFGLAFFLYKKHPNKVDRAYFEKGFNGEEIWSDLLNSLVEKKIVEVFYTGRKGKSRYRLTQNGFQTIKNLEIAAAKNREQLTREIRYNPATLPQAELFYSVEIVSEVPIVQDFTRAFNFGFPVIFNAESENSKLKTFFSTMEDFPSSGANVTKRNDASDLAAANKIQNVVSKLELDEYKESSKKW